MFYPSLDFSLGLSIPVKSRNVPEPSETRQRRGKGITGHARRMVRSAAHILEEQHGKRNLSFGTITIPSLEESEMEIIRGNWNLLVKRFVEEIGRELVRHALSPQVLHVTEMQEERYQRLGEVAPHLHLLFQGRKSGSKKWAISIKKFRQIWERMISNVLHREMSLPAGSRIEVVKKSAKRYLGKYMSKGGKILKDIVNAGLENALPASWWGMTNTLRKQVKDGIIQVDQELKNLIVDHIEDFKQAGLIRWSITVTKEIPQTHGEVLAIPVCLCGEFTSKWAMADIIHQYVTLHT
jgi:hypothetical protein